MALNPNPNINPKKAFWSLGVGTVAFFFFCMWNADRARLAPQQAPTPVALVAESPTAAPTLAPPVAAESGAVMQEQAPPLAPTPSVESPQVDLRREFPVADAPPSRAPAPQVQNLPSTPPSEGRLGFSDISVEQASARGLVWVNSDSGVYHHPGGRWYGITNQGYYTTEAEARAQGHRASLR